MWSLVACSLCMSTWCPALPLSTHPTATARVHHRRAGPLPRVSCPVEPSKKRRAFRGWKPCSMLWIGSTRILQFCQISQLAPSSSTLAPVTLTPSTSPWSLSGHTWIRWDSKKKKKAQNSFPFLSFNDQERQREKKESVYVTMQRQEHSETFQKMNAKCIHCFTEKGPFLKSILPPRETEKSFPAF